MRIILDTNVLLVSLLKTSRYRPIFDALLNKKYKLIVSHDIFGNFILVQTSGKRIKPAGNC